MHPDAAWNLGRVQSLLEKIPGELSGIKTPYQYYGSPGSVFSWHVEDSNLYSVNYLFFGKVKHWYFVELSSHGAFKLLIQVS